MNDSFDARGGGDFPKHFAGRLLDLCARWETDNVDPLTIEERYRRPLSVTRRRIKELFIQAASKGGFTYTKGPRSPCDSDMLAFVMANMLSLSESYSLLQDQASRHLFVDLLLYRAMKEGHVKLPRNNAHYWTCVRELSGLVTEKDSFSVGPESDHVDSYELTDLDSRMRLHSLPRGLLNTFLLEQYRYQGEVDIQVKPGDIAVDGGAFIGDTVLYLANRVGPQGKVFAFEFVPANLEVLRANLDLNPQLKERVEIVPHPLWNRSDEEMRFESEGARTQVGQDGKGSLVVQSLALDDWVERAGIPRVDFIKLDVEGAEENVCRGAAAVLRSYRPRLAISAYHKRDDLIRLPQLIAGYDLGYKLYLDHFTLYEAETVLFATTQEAATQ